MNRTSLSLIVTALLVSGAVAQTPSPASKGSATVAGQPQATGQTVLCDNDCIRRSAERAVQACAPRIEAQAPGDYEWLYRPYGGIFQEANPPEQPNSPVVRYRGDSIRFLSPQKEWVRAIYDCGYDTAKQEVAYLNVRLGVRGKANPVPVLPQAAAQPRQQQSQLSAAQSAQAPTSNLAPTSDRRRIGEMDEVSVIQINPAAKPR